MSVSVIIPTLNAAENLPACFWALTPGAVNGVVREVIVADGGSTDATIEIAESVGARIVTTKKGRGSQLAAGARLARGQWLLFLHADTVLNGQWIEDVHRFVDANRQQGVKPEANQAARQAARQEGRQAGGQAGVFRLKFDERGVAPSIVAYGALLRTRLFGSPYGDQGLLISRSLYEEIGGFRDMVLFEDVDLIDRLRIMKGKRAIKLFHSYAVTSATRYREAGYLRRVIRNFLCLVMFRTGKAPEEIMKFYTAGRFKSTRNIENH